MEKLLRTVKAQLEQWDEWQEAKTIVLAVSGGVDSMVLLKVMGDLLKLRNYQNRQLVVAHFNHRLREESESEAQLVQQTAEQMGLVYFCQTWDNPATQNVEASAREVRYQFFAEVIKLTQAEILMTAHHLNDVAETFMMRLTRGTSLKGIRGIRSNYTRLFITSHQEAVLAQVMRPFISITKDEIRQFATKFEVAYSEDLSNNSEVYTRNRFRKRYIPALMEENPQFLTNILALQEQLQASYKTHYANYLTIEPQLAMYSLKHYWILYIPAFLALSKDTFKVYMTLFFEERLIEDIPHYRREVMDQLEHMMRNKNAPNAQLKIGSNWIAVKKYDYIQLMPESHLPHNRFAEALTIERENHWYQVDSQTRVGIFAHHQVTSNMKNKATALCPLSIKQDEFRFLFRHRKNGDKMAFTNSEGEIYHKKVSRILIEQKLPTDQRDSAWLLCDKNDHIIWLVPNVISQLYQWQQTDKITHVCIFEHTKGE